MSLWTAEHRHRTRQQSVVPSARCEGGASARRSGVHQRWKSEVKIGKPKSDSSQREVPCTPLGLVGLVGWWLQTSLIRSMSNLLHTLSEHHAHGKRLFRISRSSKPFFLNGSEQIFRDNGFMRIVIKISIFVPCIVLAVHCLLKQHSPSVLFIREQLINCLTIPLWLTCRRWNALSS